MLGQGALGQLALGQPEEFLNPATWLTDQRPWRAITGKIPATLQASALPPFAVVVTVEWQQQAQPQLRPRRAIAADQALPLGIDTVWGWSAAISAPSWRARSTPTAPAVFLPTPDIPWGWGSTAAPQIATRRAQAFSDAAGVVPILDTVWGWAGQVPGLLRRANSLPSTSADAAVPIPSDIVPWGWDVAAPQRARTQPAIIRDLGGFIFIPPEEIRPGSGKRRDFPSYIPQPPYGAKKNPKFRPIWDRRRQEEEEARRPQPELPAGPPPLPPAELFRHSGLDTSKLPTLDQFAPPEPMAMAQRMNDARDLTDMADIRDTLSAGADMADLQDVFALLGKMTRH